MFWGPVSVETRQPWAGGQSGGNWGVSGRGFPIITPSGSPIPHPTSSCVCRHVPCTPLQLLLHVCPGLPLHGRPRVSMLRPHPVKGWLDLWAWPGGIGVPHPQGELDGTR